MHKIKAKTINTNLNHFNKGEVMEDCEFGRERYCNKISLKVDARFFWAKMLALGDVTGISKNCICINTRFCFPLDSLIELFLPFKRKVLDLSVRVDKFRRKNSIHETMCVEVLNPSKEYLDFVYDFSPKMKVLK